jgi:hypothetical protein
MTTTITGALTEVVPAGSLNPGSYNMSLSMSQN